MKKIKFYRTKSLIIYFSGALLSILIYLGGNLGAQGEELYEDFLWFGVNKYDDVTFSVNVKAYYDPDKNVADLLKNYRTFAFDYTSKENPLLEKELFKILEKELVAKGMVRSEENPDILITMNYYIGKKENYIPPQTITTTRVEYVWTSGMIGWTPTGHMEAVPVTESKTTPGKTEISYYRNIRLNFLDYKLLQGEKKPAIPPLVWIGEVESEGYLNDIRKPAQVMLKELAREWPQKSGLPAERKVGIMCRVYGDIGIRVLKDNWKTIKEVIPGSPAAQAGLKPGDVIEKINEKKTTLGYNSWIDSKKTRLGEDLYSYTMRFYDEDPYCRFVIKNTKGDPVKITVSRAGEKKPIEVSITPELKSRCRYYQGVILRDNKNYENISPDWVQGLQ